MKTHTVREQRETHSQSLFSYSMKCPYVTGQGLQLPVCVSRHGGGRGKGKMVGL